MYNNVLCIYRYAVRTHDLRYGQIRYIGSIYIIKIIKMMYDATADE